MKFIATLLPLFISLTIAIPLAAPAPGTNAMVEKRVNTQTQVDVATASMVDKNGNIKEFNPNDLPAPKRSI